MPQSVPTCTLRLLCGLSALCAVILILNIVVTFTKTHYLGSRGKQSFHRERSWLTYILGSTQWFENIGDLSDPLWRIHGDSVDFISISGEAAFNMAHIIAQEDLSRQLSQYANSMSKRGLLQPNVDKQGKGNTHGRSTSPNHINPPTGSLQGNPPLHSLQGTKAESPSPTPSTQRKQSFVGNGIKCFGKIQIDYIYCPPTVPLLPPPLSHYCPPTVPLLPPHCPTTARPLSHYCPPHCPTTAPPLSHYCPPPVPLLPPHCPTTAPPTVPLLPPHCPILPPHCPTTARPLSHYCPPTVPLLPPHCPTTAPHCPTTAPHCPTTAPPLSHYCPPPLSHYCPPLSHYCPPLSHYCPPTVPLLPPPTVPLLPPHCPTTAPPLSHYCPPLSHYCPPLSHYCPPLSHYCPPLSHYCPPLYWIEGQPDNWAGHGKGGGEDCVTSSTEGKWNDDQCSEKYYFICEKKRETK
uniref:C-type lectin domain-containing protein n=1 Tax=Xenopus tropicalis TaxID=8364 RepID=A0A1B8XYE6_XENTR